MQDLFLDEWTRQLGPGTRLSAIEIQKYGIPMEVSDIHKFVAEPEPSGTVDDVSPSDGSIISDDEFPSLGRVGIGHITLEEFLNDDYQNPGGRKEQHE